MKDIDRDTVKELVREVLKETVLEALDSFPPMRILNLDPNLNNRVCDPRSDTVSGTMPGQVQGKADEVASGG